MRYLKAVWKPPSGEAFHPLGQALYDAADVTREYVYRTDLRWDGTVAGLVGMRGDLAVAEAVLEDEPTVLDVATAESPGGEGLLYVRHEPNELIKDLIMARRESHIVMDMPIEVREDGAFVVTSIGTDAAFAESFHTLPNVDVDALETGEYTPQSRDTFDALTDRQQEAVQAAVELGYYQNPREATQVDVATEIGCSPGTAGEHLRKAEERVFSQFVGCE